MNLNKHLITILILSSLLLSALGAAFYLYKKNIQIQNTKKQMVTIFIAKNDIEAGTLLTYKHLNQTRIEKQYLLNKPLVKEEIVGKYTKDKIYKNEVFLKQNLNTQIQKEQAKSLDFEYSAYNMDFSLFENANISLHQGDIINIISVYPKTFLKKKNELVDVNVQYIAKNIKVLAFIRDGRLESKTITKHKVKKLIKKKVVEEDLEIKADEIVLDMKENTILKLIRDLNRGKQLWMVKTKKTALLETSDEPKKEDIKKLVKKVKKKVYKYKWYEKEKVSYTANAIINYEDDKSEQSKTINYTKKVSNLCTKIKNNLLLVNSNLINIRQEKSLDSKVIKRVSKNTIIPYIMKNDSWYLLCDKAYVHDSVVKEISYEKAKSLVGAK